MALDRVRVFAFWSASPAPTTLSSRRIDDFDQVMRTRIALGRNGFRGPMSIPGRPHRFGRETNLDVVTGRSARHAIAGLPRRRRTDDREMTGHTTRDRMRTRGRRCAGFTCLSVAVRRKSAPLFVCPATRSPRWSRVVRTRSARACSGDCAPTIRGGVFFLRRTFDEELPSVRPNATLCACGRAARRPRQSSLRSRSRLGADRKSVRHRPRPGPGDVARTRTLVLS